MSKSLIWRSLSSHLCDRCQRSSVIRPFTRALSNSLRKRADDEPAIPSGGPFSSSSSSGAGVGSRITPTRKIETSNGGVSSRRAPSTPLADISSFFSKLENDRSGSQGRAPARRSLGGSLNFDYDSSAMNLRPLYDVQPPHHFHIYATKHNTHITVTKPNRDALISVSTGNIGFRKAGRGSYDAAYQLAAYVLGRIQEQGLMSEIQKLEVILRGWGPGREAVTKVLCGSEGRNIRGRVVRVTDATRLKFGGTRSPKPRRLG
ncbi:MAG: hypothetical protein M1827_007470 [Pycnora praestabilis]|nr:MAG: hypothetical protein M1827_007470 [Pycnora praestabilis]